MYCQSSANNEECKHGERMTWNVGTIRDENGKKKKNCIGKQKTRSKIKFQDIFSVR